LKILHIIKQLHLGGAEKVLLSLCSGLAHHEHSVLACRLDFTARLKALGVSSQLYEQHNDEELRALILSAQPDTVFYHWYPDRYLEAAEVIHRYDIAVDLPAADWVTIVHDAAERTPRIRSTRHYVAVSQFIADHHNHLPAERVSLIKNGVPIPPEVERSYTGAPVLVKIARADPDRFEESFFSLLSSLREHAWTLRLVLADGPMLPQIKDWIQGYELTDRVTIDLDVLEVAPALRAGHIFLDLNPPSCREAWGMAVSEALAAGLPVVGRDLYGVREQVESGRSGFLCERDDEIRDRLVELLRNPELLRAMSRQARQRAVKALPVSRMIEQYDALLRARAAPRVHEANH